VTSSQPRGVRWANSFGTFFARRPLRVRSDFRAYDIDLPKRRQEDPNDILNLRIPIRCRCSTCWHYLGVPGDVHSRTPGQACSIRTGSRPAFRVYGPVSRTKVTLHLRDVTVREILNAVTVATENPKGNAAMTIRAHGYIGQEPHREVKPNWGTFFSLPPNWRELVASGSHQTVSR